jgi:Plasmid pRiA4b ORF-3-like protein
MAKKRAPKRLPPAGGLSDAVYQLKIILAHVQRPIWRRLEVPDCTLAELHEMIQACMPWQNYHLWSFEAGGKQYGPEVDRELGWQDASTVRLGQLVGAGLKKLLYTYDYGDDWQHQVQVEKTLPGEPKVRYPRCTAGARACPPEDCGGVWGYEDLLAIIANPKHKEHEERLEWLGGPIDPEAFDLDAVNRELRRLA